MAFEMAVLLEKEGYTGTLILIDGAPDFLTTAAKTVFNNQDQQSFDTNLLHGIYNIYVPGVNVEVKDTLNTYFTWEEKLNYLESIIPESAIYDREYQRRATSDLRHRLNAVINYDTSNYEKLSWETILIRPQEQFFPTSFPENYNLSKVSNCYTNTF